MENRYHKVAGLDPVLNWSRKKKCGPGSGPKLIRIGTKNSRITEIETQKYHVKDIEGIINHDLRMLVSWAAQWLINFNPLKTEAMLFTLRLIESLPNLIKPNISFILTAHHRVFLCCMGRLHRKRH